MCNVLKTCPSYASLCVPKLKFFKLAHHVDLDLFLGNVCSKIKVSACVCKNKYKAHYMFSFLLMCMKEGNIWGLLCEGTSKKIHVIIIQNLNIHIFKSP
jgi:hypothetical protein